MSINLGKGHPELYQQLISLSSAADEAAAKSGLDPRLIELVKIRVSQLNGCAFCLRMHTRDAVEKGETSDRLAVLPAWWESQYFDDAEQSALALAEQITGIGEQPRHDVIDDALNPEQTSAVAWLAVVMNSWNRVAITSHYPVQPELPAGPDSTSPGRSPGPPGKSKGPHACEYCCSRG